jgi:hypothetical protein
MPETKRVCLHEHWSWFKPLNRGTAALFCASCGKWSWQIRNRKALAEAAKLYRALNATRG